jgi:plastocyanin
MLLGGASVFSAIAACSSGGPGTNPNGPPAPVFTNSVSIVNNEFNPPNVGINAGGTVTWTWNSAGTDHNVKWNSAPTSALPNDSPTMNAGTFSVMFATPGTYKYVCNLHSNMEGFVTVQ